MVFSFLKKKACISHILIVDERFIALDKNPLRVLKCEHMKKFGGFTQMDISVKAYWVGYFEASLEKLQCKCHQRPPELGKGDAHLSFF